MSGRYPEAQRPTRSTAAAETRRSGPHLGPVRITPLRVTLLVALAGGLAFLGYSIIVRDQLQVPLMATGLAVCGLAVGAAAVLSVLAVMRAGREGRDGAAVLTALAGGLAAIASLMLLAGAAIMALIWTGTQSA